MRAALESLRRNDPSEALRVVVEAWRASRAPELAALVEVLGTLTARPSRPEGEGSAARQARWLAAAAADDPAALGALLDELYDATGAPEVTERLDALARGGDDPRVASTALTALETLPFKKSFGPEGSPFYARCLALAAAIADPRSRPRLEAARKRHAGAAYNPGLFVRKRLQAAAEAAGATLARGSWIPLGAEERALVGELRAVADALSSARLGDAGRGEALLAQVYAAPGDDEPRAVYGDWLSERGDPRGELVALQLARHRAGGTKASEREKALLDTHGKAWLGPLAGAVLKQGQRWERGFLDACVFAPKTKDAYAAALGHPSWATVTEIELRTWNRKGDAWPFLSSPVFASLRAVRGLREEAVVELLAGGGLPRLELLGWDLARAERRTKKAEKLLTELAALPSLRAVELVAAEGALPEEAAAFAARITRVPAQVMAR